MPHFKDQDNKVFWLDDGDDPAVWLPQCVQITDEEAETLRVALAFGPQTDLGQQQTKS